MCFLMNLLYLTIVIFAQSSYQISETKPASSYLSDTKFGFNEYNEYSDADDAPKGPQAPPAPQWSQSQSRQISQGQTTGASPAAAAQGLDPSIKWDDKWPSAEVEFGQLSAVAIDPDGNVAAFARGSRVWGSQTFGDDNKFDRDEGAIRENTVTLLSAETGKRISEWGRNLFYLPHGLTIDLLGNYWITDVAMHQVFKFDAKDIPKDSNIGGRKEIKPVLVLGDAFEPGNSNNRFCKPTGVAVEKNGDFFVSDGYCNSRIIKFNHKGERILTWGRNWGGGENLMFSMHVRPPNFFFVPHALALAEELGLLFVADRENGRITSFHAQNGTYVKEYHNPLMGSRIFSVAYAAGKIYAVNGPDFTNVGTRVRGFVLDINSGEILSQFAPGKDLQNPHDVAVTQDGKTIYVVELNPYKIHRFFKDSINGTIPNSKVDQSSKKISDSLSLPSTGVRSSLTPQVVNHESSIFPEENGSQDSSTSKRTGVTASTIILSLITAAVALVGLCVGVAAVVARCRKRGRVYIGHEKEDLEF